MKFSKTLALVLAGSLVFAMAGCQPAPQTTASSQQTQTSASAVAPPQSAATQESSQPAVAIKAGTYKAVAKGYYGDFDVSVTLSDTAITEISVSGSQETPSLGGLAIEMLKTNIVDANSVGVDAISGATVTSIVFKNAIIDCLTQAGAPTAMFDKLPAPSATDEALKTDVLVIGSGAAGYSAAIKAAEAGAKVTIIEKQDIIGGSSITCGGIIYAPIDQADTTKVIDYYTQRAEGNIDKDLLKFHVENSLDNIKFFEGLSVEWYMTLPAGTATEARARFAKIKDGTTGGAAMINPMAAKAKELGVSLLTGVSATELITSTEGAVVGAKATSKTKNYTFEAGAVVLATGGFDASSEMIAKYSPTATGDFPISSKGNVGDGLNMGIAVGADTLFKGGVIGFEMVNASLPGQGYSSVATASNVYVKPDGEFAGAKVDYPIVYTNLKKAGGDKFFGIFDAAGQENAQKAVDKGFGFKADTIEALATATGMDAAKLAASVAKNPDIKTAPYFAVDVKTCTLGSMGGLVINTSSQVLKQGTPIPGLYAAGEVANGQLFYLEYPASGTSISTCLTFGFQAGINAAAFAKK